MDREDAIKAGLYNVISDEVEEDTLENLKSFQSILRSLKIWQKTSR